MTKYFLVAIAVLVQSTVAQPEVERLYEGGFYDKVIETADSCLQQKLTKSDLETIHKYKAFAYVALDEKGKAKEEFKIVLLLDPTLKLDPSLISPKIIDVFEQAKTEMPVEALQPAPVLTPPVLTERKNISYLLFPGIFQLSTGQKTKGSVLLCGEIVALAGLAVTHIGTVNAHNDYLKARDQSEIESTFSSYQKWFWIRTGFAGSALTVYLATVIDGFRYQPPLKKTGFYLQPSFSGVAFGYSW